ncbi:Crp/Fnr family transcriptional regulator [Sphingobacterium sp. UT-1RO-CII-1]|uniref:Crp/Fnr family transcriptional regulator n=1 Tax=Sphingobacterium sp. UT-1RO-CII-1 TaxID=2995225 RepID=UPI00227AD09B|nr:Crp/Fnr family transcriptional regulator [Sphingobacterium sp. UT-1RO-CII-1]MCY4778334.1 Crp/Fnr family transcriptional regulator [Sphingobacterium sp. UT-1RO-CII-1]
MEALDIIQAIGRLNTDELDKLVALFEPIQFQNKKLIIEADKTARHIYFLKEGACRIYYHKEEKEVVLDFCFPGDVLMSLNSYIHGTPGYETIETLEKTTLYKVDIHKLQHLFEQSIGIANWGRKLAELQTLKIEFRLMSKLFKTAAESYNELLLRSPEIVQRIKLGYIASYLGISQVTLSRIRAKI